MASTAPQALASKTCGVCKKSCQKLFACGRCSGINYCGKECQEADWTVHKMLCKIYAETPCPNGSVDLRRVILFSPLRKTPEIRWVRPSSGWVVSLLRAVPDRPLPRRLESEDVLVYRVPHKPVAEHHTSLIFRNNYVQADGSKPNLALKACMDTAQLTIARRGGYLGPVVAARHEGKDMWGEYLIPDGLKLLDVTMEDFRDTLKWIANNRDDGEAEMLSTGTHPMQTPKGLLDWLAKGRLCPVFTHARDMEYARITNNISGALDVESQALMHRVLGARGYMPADSPLPTDPAASLAATGAGYRRMILQDMWNKKQAAEQNTTTENSDRSHEAGGKA